MPRFKNTRGRLQRTNKGAGLVEYGLVAGLVSVLAIGAVSTLGGEIQSNTLEVSAVLSEAIASAQGTSSDSGQSGTQEPQRDGRLDSYAIHFVWDAGQPDQAAASFHIASPTEPNNPWALGVGALAYTVWDGFEQSGSAVPVSLNGALGAAFLSYDDTGYGGGLLRFVLPSQGTTPPMELHQFVGAGTDPWMSLRDFVSDVEDNGVPFDPETPVALGTAAYLCEIFRPVGPDVFDDPGGGAFVGRLIDHGADTGAPSGRWMWALTCSASGDEGSLAERSGVSGSWYPLP